ncbi:pyrimidine dimer DNA glycosylase/endonuclease V [Ottowia testudinis]|uniref:pyrimidine dimer DNA glycosylase/endonuclease V n=1 Tax=Ottowia testudinis TaxID=2816950 RepID=UPI001FB100D0|nr:pyrimidine dimer DNA glycosylase/endonuclease V [Ottowia testudinis]
MRIWTLHPRHLDPQGLVALWRETLLAQAVLAGRTRGYTRHPQLQRFAEHAEPLDALGAYLTAVAAEAQARSYRFDASKIDRPSTQAEPIAATTGQIEHEWRHLGAKLAVRNPDWHARWAAAGQPSAHPLFTLVPGPVQGWERL